MDTSQDKTPSFSSQDKLKHKIIDFTINQCVKACGQQEPISDDNYETGFIQGTSIASSMLWKHAPDEIRKTIEDLYTEMDNKIEEIEQSNLSETNKKLNKRKVSYSISFEVLKLLIIVLQYSPMSTEFAQMEVFGDFKELIKKIRTEKKVSLFSGEIEDK